MNNKSQVFSTDLIVAVIIFLFILISSAWFWDSTKEKIHITETRSDLELLSNNAISVMVNTVGDPPNWHKITFNDSSVYSIGVGKNRPWLLSENKLSRLVELNDTDYPTIKRILGVRGAGYNMYFNISKINKSDGSLIQSWVFGEYPKGSASHVVAINRFALSNIDRSWLTLNFLFWSECVGAECY